MSKTSKSKGKAGEREAALLVQSVVNRVCRELGAEAPCIQRNLNQARGGGYDLYGLDWLALEVKRCETLTLPAWWRQTLRQCKPGQEPLLMYRRSHEPWQCVLYGHTPHGLPLWAPAPATLRRVTLVGAAGAGDVVVCPWLQYGERWLAAHLRQRLL